MFTAFVELDIEIISRLVFNFRQYESWEWVFGKSPKFTFDLGQDDLNISVVNGIMKLPDEEEIKLTKEAIQYLKTSPYRLLWNKLQEIL